MSKIIKRPFIKSVEFCIDENIWGHRLYDEQLPHLTVLEFLGVLGSNLNKPLRPHDGLGGAVNFKPQRQMRLRGLLFNNPFVESIAETRRNPRRKTARSSPTRRSGVSGSTSSIRGRPATGTRPVTWPTCVSPSRASTTSPRRSSCFVPRPLRRAATSAGARSSSSLLAQTPSTRT